MLLKDNLSASAAPAVSQDEVAGQAEVCCCYCCRARMVGLYAANGDDAVVLLCYSISQQKLQLAHLQGPTHPTRGPATCANRKWVRKHKECLIFRLTPCTPAVIM